TEHVRIVKTANEVAARGWKHISILKLDTEGCEVPILTDFLAVVPEIDIIYCEFHSEEDRRRIEAIVADRFILYWAKVDCPHLGICVYLAKALARKYPYIDSKRKSFLDGDSASGRSPS